MRKRILACVILAAVSGASAIAQRPAEPALLLANEYSSEINLDEYWVSEKLDGIRAVWDGTSLYTRKGTKIHAPAWFTEGLPSLKMEGELWAGRGKFHVVQQTVMDKTPFDTAWKNIQFMIFDLPHSAGDYAKRYYDIKNWVKTVDQHHIQYVEHISASNHSQLMKMLDRVDDNYGEGLMLRKVSKSYRAGRSDDLLKLKKHADAEATIIGYKPGEGKYHGMLGSYLVRCANGKEFYIGSGLKDSMRKQPLPIGATITYRFNGRTESGKPRFARFLRERVE
ncbi:DNA ligase [Vibrio penaeicida]|uniref:ATP-dependent DNA ligase n=1 Tax=Vibrio penaeicida TaxID=104609 RepID=A0AAV5NIZ9_9VIBR|nr:DNA ligase [Vibrio penaeicida]RTZ23902.1 DNA ligase [Vibrio penaeicida]GLQ70646.1 ATP-dependent DNA ligase [Vibrio penaeicida]